ncbi:MAG: hypothetical protein ACYCWN_09590 [Ferrimicrobium sp.]|uniref:Uncharacterized protein n=1 Tax=Ferrimicrobium acidiphilum TaxID=121039 RepID=A0ABV3Y362_9ACTN|nr:MULTISPECIES: hypothetical protein [Ferrimicrobium]
MRRIEDYRRPTWPDSEVPLDLAVTDLDAIEQVALGAGRYPAKIRSWRVLIDPARHPSCLTTLIPE